MITIPETVSEQARAFIETLPAPGDIPAFPAANDLSAWDKLFADNEAFYQAPNQAVVEHYQPVIEKLTLGGVPVLNVLPRHQQESEKGTPQNRDKVIVYLHGGGYTLFSAASTLMSAVPVAHECGCRVVSVDYTRAPRACWQEILQQCTAVVCTLREGGYDWKDIVLFGDSAGGALAAATVLKMRDDGLGMPSAVVLWSPWSDITETGDCYQTLKEADPVYLYCEHLAPCALAYADQQDHRHPYVSPVYGDYRKGFPPTLIQGGTREIFLSNFVRHYQALDKAGISVKLDLYEGMVHVFQAGDPTMPEAQLARRKMQDFLASAWSKNITTYFDRQVR